MRRACIIKKMIDAKENTYDCVSEKKFIVNDKKVHFTCFYLRFVFHIYF